MYTYRKKIQLSHSATASGFSDINVLSLSGFGINKIADVEVKVTAYDVANAKSSIVYYRNVEVIDSAAAPSYYNSNDSSFFYREDTSTAAYVYDVAYNQTTSNIVIRASNPTATTLNTICIIDYKINFY
jgi:hypothetical protein